MVNISGLTSGDTSELEVSYTHGYHSQRLLSWEQFKCNGVRSRGSTRVIITLPVVNQIANRAVICCCDKCVVRSNCKRAFFYEKYADMHFVTPLLLSKNIGNDILDDGSPTDVCSPVFTRVHPCSSEFIRVHPCSLVFTRVHLCSLVFTRVHPCSLVFTRVHPCSPVFTKACEKGFFSEYKPPC